MVTGGTLYVGSCSGLFLALDTRTGGERWRYDTTADGPRAQFHGDALLVGDTIVIGSDARPEGRLYAFDRSSGSVRWSMPFAGGVAADILQHGDAALAVTLSGEVMALDPHSGEVRWRFDDVPPEAAGSRPADPALGGGRLFVAWRPGYVDALDAATGRLLWRRRIEGIINTSVAVAGGGVVFGMLDGRLLRLDPQTGATLGTFESGGGLYGKLVTADGCILALWAQGGFGTSMDASGPFVIACVDPSLEAVRWRFASEREWSTFKPLVVDDTVVAGRTGELVGLQLADGTEVWRRAVDGEPKGMAAAGTRLFVGTLGGPIMALPR